jgi:hypothetical protein
MNFAQRLVLLGLGVLAVGHGARGLADEGAKPREHPPTRTVHVLIRDRADGTVEGAAVSRSLAHEYTLVEEMPKGAGSRALYVARWSSNFPYRDPRLAAQKRDHGLEGALVRVTGEPRLAYESASPAASVGYTATWLCQYLGVECAREFGFYGVLSDGGEIDLGRLRPATRPQGADEEWNVEAGPFGSALRLKLPFDAARSHVKARREKRDDRTILTLSFSLSLTSLPTRPIGVETAEGGLLEGTVEVEAPTVGDYPVREIRRARVAGGFRTTKSGTDKYEHSFEVWRTTVPGGVIPR